MSIESNVAAVLRGVHLSQGDADRISKMAYSRVIAEEQDCTLDAEGSVDPRTTAKDALDAVYAAIVRTAEHLPAFDFALGGDLSGLAAVLHELKQW